MSSLIIKNINKLFGKAHVLKDIDFKIKDREFTSILGPSGCGKTTLLRIIAGLEEASSGSIILDGVDITEKSPSKRDFGMVFQSYALFPNLTAYENIAFGLKNRRVPKKVIREKIEDVLNLVGLWDLKDRYPAQLSGGQQQRVAIARVLVLSPKLLLLDEPLSALDARVRLNLRREIRDLHEKLNITTIMVTHDQEEALTISDRLVVMDHGIVMQTGTPETIYEQPANEFVADFIGTMNFINSEKRRVAIRPENIEIFSEDSGEYKGVLTQSEFRGSFYRLSLQLDDDSKVEVDVKSEIYRLLNVSAKKNFSLKLKRDKVLEYN